jgi:Rrf2 family iron-sulfur cluster assembly transcriptional regulator
VWWRDTRIHVADIADYMYSQSPCPPVDSTLDVAIYRQPSQVSHQMKISTKSLKAIKAILDVAVLSTSRPVSLAEIGKRRGISISHLEVIFRQLRKNGLVRSTRGPGGGYRLNRHFSDISIADIVSAVDEKNHPANLSSESGFGAKDVSLMSHQLWRGLDDHLKDYLGTVTLATLIEANGNERRSRPSQAVPSAHSKPTADADEMAVL